jgi:hypothetical protein
MCSDRSMVDQAQSDPRVERLLALQAGSNRLDKAVALLHMLRNNHAVLVDHALEVLDHC